MATRNRTIFSRLIQVFGPKPQSVAKSLLGIVVAFSLSPSDTLASSQCAWEFLRKPGFSIPQQFEGAISRFKRDYAGQFLNYTAATTEENQIWIDIALSGQQDQFFFMVEQSKMKEANDHVFEGDKETVTALTNLHKSFFMTALKTFMPREIIPYSDFKVINGTAKLSLDHHQKENFKKVVLKAYQYALIRVKSILDMYDPTLFYAIGFESWMKVGFGTHADEANLAVREVRRHRGFFQADYSDEETQKALRNAQIYTEYYRIKLEAMAVAYLDREPEVFRNMFSEVTDQTYTINSLRPPVNIRHTKTYIPSPALFELMRKEKTKESLAAKIYERFGYQISLDDAQLLIDYSYGIDLFSPALFIPERVQANLNEAENGGMTIDFVGMGADNWFIVALALAKQTTLNRELLLQIRQNEQNLTTLINLKKRMLRSFLEEFFRMAEFPISPVVCSGDDCTFRFLRSLAFPELKELYTQMLYTYADRAEPYRLRFSTIDGGFPEDLRTKVATIGELVEKDIRKSIQSDLSFSEYKDIAIGVLLENSQSGVIIHPIIVTRNKNKRLLSPLLDRIKAELANKYASYLPESSISVGPITIYER